MIPYPALIWQTSDFSLGGHDPERPDTLASKASSISNQNYILNFRPYLDVFRDSLLVFFCYSMIENHLQVQNITKWCYQSITAATTITTPTIMLITIIIIVFNHLHHQDYVDIHDHIHHHPGFQCWATGFFPRCPP